MNYSYKVNILDVTFSAKRTFIIKWHFRGCKVVAIKMVIRWCLMLMTLVHQSARSKRLVVNTTCVELAKSSNQQLRLSCDNPDYYHCLIDGSNTREYEVCRTWKWISKGNSQQNLTFLNDKTVPSPQCT